MLASRVGNVKMDDGHKTKAELLVELAALRRRVSELESAHAEEQCTEIALRESENKFRALFEQAAVGVAQIETFTGRFVTINQRYCDIVGYSFDEMLNISFQHLTYPDDLQADLDNMCRLHRNEIREFSMEKRYFHKNGSVVWVNLTVSPLWRQGEYPNYHIAVVEDITERKRAVQELSESRALFRSLVDSMPQNVFSKDMGGRFVFANQSYCMTENKTLDEILGKTDFDLHPVDLAKQYRADDLRVIETGQIAEREEAHQPLGGDKSYVQVVKAPVYDAEKQIKGILGIFWDITPRKQAEEAERMQLERVRRQQANLVALATHPTFSAGDVAGAVCFLTESVSETLDIDRVSVWLKEKDVLEMRCHDLYSRTSAVHTQGGIIIPQDFPVYFAAIENSRSIDIYDVYNDPCTREFGKAYLKLNRITSMLSSAIRISGQMVGIVCLEHVDSPHTWQTDEIAFAGEVADQMAQALANAGRQKAEAEIRQLNAELEQRVLKRTIQLETANKELEAFSYSVSHDLRAPLRNIDGWSYVLLEDYYDKLDEQGRVYLGRVRSEAQRMGQLINGLLQLSRLSRIEMKHETVNLSTLANQAVERLWTDEPLRQVVFDIQEGLYTQGDLHLLNIALTNLLENAFKFTSKCAEAHIRFGLSEVDGQQVFFVSDNGIGFDMKYAKNLFGAFQRVHMETEFPGTGIGLATVHRIVNRHGGRIWAQAEPGKGATFYFILSTNDLSV